MNSKLFCLHLVQLIPVQAIVDVKDTVTKDTVKTEDTNDVEIIQVDTRTSRGRAKNYDLPLGAHDNDTFRQVVVTTIVKQIAKYDDPWKIDDKILIFIMQAIWDKVYGHSIPHQIKLGDAVFKIVCSLFQTLP
jgi:hypothetical protein